MKYFFIFIFLFSQNVFSQSYQLSGTVINAADNSKLASASIFINSSTMGTLSDAEGKFTLNGISNQNFSLIISYTGFTTVSLQITPENIGKFHVVKMIPRENTLDQISIMIPVKDGWKKWGKFFTESFIGLSDLAKDCIIENPKTLLFFNDKKHNKLKAYSNGNLIIRNEALGYLVKYQLEEFDYDFTNKIITFVGYTNFQDLKTKSSRKRNRWIKARKEAYEGSIMHFMRALYADSTAAEGFNVYEKIRIYNTDTLFNKIYLPGKMPDVRMGNSLYKSSPGAIPAFKKIPEYINLTNVDTFSFADAVTTDFSTKQKEFYFDNYLQVIYKNKNLKKDYLLANGLPADLKINERSDAHLASNESLTIEADGSYFDSVNLQASGYWGWCKIAEMLPTDYKNE